MRKKDNNEQQVITKYESHIRRRGFYLYISALVFGFVTEILGVFLCTQFPKPLPTAFYIIQGLFIALPPVLFISNLIISKLFVNKLNKLSIADMQQYFLTHRETAEETEQTKQILLKNLRTFSDIYAVCIGIIGFGIALLGGINYSSDFSVPIVFLSAYCYLGAFSRIRFKVPQVAFDEDKQLIKPSEYPYLYQLARKAADAMNCKKEIQIALISDVNAGIATINNVYLIQLGAVLVNILSEEELYTVLLHEFAHVQDDETRGNKEMSYYSWLYNGGNVHYASNLTNILFRFVDTVYGFQFTVYQYASSINRETRADRAMVAFGDANATASALLKLKFYNLFLWERVTCDDDNLFFAEETPYKGVCSMEIADFQKTSEQRKEYWKHFVDVEILSRNSSHPTLKMRLDALGLSVPELANCDTTPQYADECRKALKYMDELIYEDSLSNYEQARKANYLEPQKLVNEWEENGKQINPEGYADIVYALRQLGRCSEAIEVCDRAINELSTDSEKCYAYFTKGCYLLHRFDENGIPLVYQALNHNNNYIEEGLTAIGEFSCLTGNQEELDTYREKAIQLVQKQKDVYSQTSFLQKSDKLMPENLPDGMLEQFLSYVSSIDEGSIKNIYLVRKVITEDFFTSAVVVRFVDKTEDEIQENVMHKIFSYLDTCGEWQFSLFHYDNVKNIPFDKIENSCVYGKNK